MANGTRGVWEPHTSSIDFCEENYRFTPYVAELLNSASAVPIIAAGVWAWLRTPARYRSAPRFALCWIAFIIVGFGSALFHATLRRPAQAMDEVPMVLFCLHFAFCLLRPSSSDALATALAAGLGLLGAALLALYIVWEAYVVFVVVFGSNAIFLVVKSWLLVFRSSPGLEGNGSVLRQLWWLGLLTYAFGFGLWVADNLVCHLLGFGHLHIVWHIFGCYGTLTFVLLMVALAADGEHIGVEVAWLRTGGLPILPFLMLQEKSKAS